MIRIFLLLFLLSCSSYQLWSQRPDSSTSSSSREDDKYLPLDSLQIDMYDIEGNFIGEYALDSILDNLTIYDPNNQQSFYKRSLGNVASVSSPMFYNPLHTNEKTIQYGWEILSPNRYSKTSFRHFVTNKPVARVQFSGGVRKQNFVVDAHFFQRYKDDISLSFNYKRILQDGQYEHQINRTTNLSLGVIKDTKQGSVSFLFLRNAYDYQQNGGISITIDSLNNNARYVFSRTLVPVNLESAQNRIADNQYILTSNTLLNKSVSDTKIRLRNTLSYLSSNYRFSDDEIADASQIIYGSYLTDDRGLRTKANATNLDMSSKVDLSLSAFNISVGLQYSMHHYNRVFNKEVLHDFNILGEIEYSIKKKWFLDGKVAIGAGENIGTYDISGTLSTTISSFGKLSAGIRSVAERPELRIWQMYSNQQLVVENDFGNPINTTLFGKMTFERIPIEVKGYSSLLTNAVFADLEGLPEQNDEVLNAYGIDLEYRGKTWIFGHQIRAGVQQWNDNYFQYPSFVWYQDLYMDTSLFHRRLQGRLGANFKYASQHSSIGYSTPWALFHRTDLAARDFINLDGYFSFKVSQLSAYIKFENIVQYFVKDQYALIENYPLFDYRIRFGARWNLFD